MKLGYEEWQQGLMLEALELARLGKGRTFPNPVVGALVVRGGEIVGRGFHRRWGMDHAEVEAMRDAGEHCRGADLYVTLEPCCHQGKTPPCIDAIIGKGIRRVFAATLDPNPVVNGRGVQALKHAGLTVDVGLGAAAAMRLNEAYFKFMKTVTPFVTVKIAQTLDGKIAARNGNARWITSAASRRLVRSMRSDAQAVVVGVRTVALDNPQLLSRPSRSKNYVRCVLDTRLSISPRSRVVRSAGQFPVIVYCGTSADAKRRRQLERAGAEVREVEGTARGLLDLRCVLGDLAQRGIMHAWIEGGSAVFTSFLGEGLADKVIFFTAPKLMGEGGSLSSIGDLGVKAPGQCLKAAIDSIECTGEDLVVTAYPVGRWARAGKTFPRRRSQRTSARP